MSQLKCPKCSARFGLRENVEEVTCPQCQAVLRLGNKFRDSQRGAKRSKTDNKAATTMLIGVGVVFVLVLGLLLAFAGDDDGPSAEEKARMEASRRREEYLNSAPARSGLPPAPDEKSKTPVRIAEAFVVALANLSDEGVENLVWWERLFEQLGRNNKWTDDRKYALKDDDGKKTMRESYLIDILDPDRAEVLNEVTVPLIESGDSEPWRVNVGPDWGNVHYRARRGKYILDVYVATQLMDGFDPIKDTNNMSAWRIVRLQFEERGKLVDGVRRRHTKRDFGTNIGKPVVVRRTRRGANAGPLETDPYEVSWVTGTSADQQTELTDLVNKLGTLDGIEMYRAREALSKKGKVAIPAMLRKLAQLDHKDKNSDISHAWNLITTLHEMVDKRFGYAPKSGGAGPMRRAIGHASPEERIKAIRQWFGWWKLETNEGEKYVPRVLGGDDDESWWNDKDKDKDKK